MSFEVIDSSQERLSNLLSHPAVQQTRNTILTLSDLIKIQKVNALLDHSAYQKLAEHRSEYYQIYAPHLLQPAELENSYQVDLRSQIFVIEYENTILASLRLTPAPFEFEKFNFDFCRQTVNSYLEVGRLVTSPQIDRMTSVSLVRLLLCAAGLDTVEQNVFKGLVGICKTERMSLFEKFGMQFQSQFHALSRGVSYHYMKAPLHRILDHAAGLHVSENQILKRIKKSLSNDDTKESHEII